MKSFEFQVPSDGDGDTLDVTGLVSEAVGNSGFEKGIVTVFVPGSTAGLTTIEFEPGAVRDLSQAIARMAPREIPYDHNARWGDGNGHSHVRAAMIGPSLTIPFSNTELMLGAWQQVILIDFDNRKRSRRLICQVIGE